MKDLRPIPYGRQNITEEDITAVVETLKSDYLTQGPKILEFEKAFADYVGSRFAIAVSNGTAALHLSAIAMGIKPGDRVITTPITFAASANCVKYCGGEVECADIDPETYLIDIGEVKKLLEAAPKGTYKGIIPVDFSGMPVNLEALRNLANEHGLWIIEDACHAPGGYFMDSNDDQQRCGNGKFADLAIFSFHPVKHIACGEGGMITTNNEQLYSSILRLRTHGITKDPMHFQNNSFCQVEGNNSENPTFPLWYYEMQELGFNYRLTDIQAALGLSQLKRANAGLRDRESIARKYSQAFTNRAYILGHSGSIIGHGYHLYIIEVEEREALYVYMRKHNIFAQVHYIPTHLMPYYLQFGWKEGDYPHSERYYEQCLSLPMYPTLSDAEQSFVIQTIERFYTN